MDNIFYEDFTLVNLGTVTDDILKKLEDDSILIEVYGKHKNISKKRKTQISNFSSDESKMPVAGAPPGVSDSLISVKSENLASDEKTMIMTSKMDQITSLIAKAEKDGKKKIKV